MPCDKFLMTQEIAPSCELLFYILLEAIVKFCCLTVAFMTDGSCRREESLETFKSLETWPLSWSIFFISEILALHHYCPILIVRAQ